MRESSGIVELANDLLKMMVRTGATSVAKSCSVRGSITSGPASLYGFIFSNICSTSGNVTLMLCISGCGLSPISDKGSVVIGLKADLHWRFRTFALSRGCCMSSPLSFSGATNVVSLRLALIRLHSFLMPWSIVGFTMSVRYCSYEWLILCCALRLKDLNFEMFSGVG